MRSGTVWGEVWWKGVEVWGMRGSKVWMCGGCVMGGGRCGGAWWRTEEGVPRFRRVL